MDIHFHKQYHSVCICVVKLLYDLFMDSCSKLAIILPFKPLFHCFTTWNFLRCMAICIKAYFSFLFFHLSYINSIIKHTLFFYQSSIIAGNLKVEKFHIFTHVIIQMSEKNFEGIISNFIWSDSFSIQTP